MPLSWNEIEDRALKFSREWVDESSEDAEAKSFLDAFFNVFGVPRKRRVATFEKRVKKLDGRDGYIDLLWKGILLVEHKSRGKDLDRAYSQAKDYFPGLKDTDAPRYILVSDFERFRLYDLEEDKQQDKSAGSGFARTAPEGGRQGLPGMNSPSRSFIKTSGCSVSLPAIKLHLSRSRTRSISRPPNAWGGCMTNSKK